MRDPEHRRELLVVLGPSQFLHMVQPLLEFFSTHHLYPSLCSIEVYSISARIANLFGMSSTGTLRQPPSIGAARSSTSRPLSRPSGSEGSKQKASNSAGGNCGLMASRMALNQWMDGIAGMGCLLHGFPPKAPGCHSRQAISVSSAARALAAMRSLCSASASKAARAIL